MIQPLRDRAHDIVTTSGRAVIFHQPATAHPWHVYLPFSWPSINGMHTLVFKTHADAVGAVVRVLRQATPPSSGSININTVHESAESFIARVRRTLLTTGIGL